MRTSPRSSLRVLVVLAGLVLARPGPARATGPSPLPPEDERMNLVPPSQQAQPPEWFSLHFQFTADVQYHPSFSAPYTGRNSLSPDAEAEVAMLNTLFADVRLWKGAELIADPEMSGGKGLSNTTGVAAYPNGLIYRVGDPTPAVYVARLLLKQTIGLGGGKVPVAPDANQLAGLQDKNRLTLYFGRFSLSDQLDGNPYAHDATTQFLSWALWESGAWDYASDTRGYTWGLLADLTWSWWSLRAAVALEPRYANLQEIEWRFWKSLAYNLEFQARWTLFGRPGSARLLGFVNDARMGDYAQAVANPALYHDDVTATRAYGRIKYGLALSANQEVLPGKLGAFLRASWNDGHTESWAFTEIDSSLALGTVLDGVMWRRPDDEVGAAFVLSGLSSQHRAYLAAGGYGFIVGDSKLNYAPEFLAEIYYKAQLTGFVALIGTYQPVVNPAYNQDRGPVHILSARVHVQF